jgi:hypothetical protein
VIFGENLALAPLRRRATDRRARSGDLRLQDELTRGRRWAGWCSACTPPT